jgi:hypothetical protein
MKTKGNRLRSTNLFNQTGSSIRPKDTLVTNEIAARLAPNASGPSSSARPCMATRRKNGRLALTRQI